MYTPKHYKNENTHEIKAFIRENSFGILVNILDQKPWATHIPLVLEEVDGRDYLVGHIAKANPQWQQFSNNAPVLCIFNGPHAYISSSWYKEEEVPTWNYIAVHVYGKLQVLTEEETLASLHKLVEIHEASVDNPIDLNTFSKATMRQVKGVVGFKIEVEEYQATYKLSQTRTEDHQEIISQLKQGGVTEQEIARHISELKS